MPAPSIRSFANSLSRFKKNARSSKTDKQSLSPKPKELSPAQKLADATRAKDADKLSIKKDDADEQSVRSLVLGSKPVSADLPPVITTPHPTGKTAPPVPTTARATSKANPYLSIWNLEENEGEYPVRAITYSHYLPNSISIYQTLADAHRILSGNKSLKKENPGYLPLAVNIGIGIMFYLRILHVRRVYGMNSPAAAQFLNRFEKQFCKVDDLPIPTILEPHFAALSAAKPNDNRVSDLLPYIPDNLGGNATTDIYDLTAVFSGGPNPTTSISGGTVLFGLPVLPILLDWMRYFIDANLDDTAIVTPANPGTNPPTLEVTKPRHNENGLFVPFAIQVDETTRSRTLAGHSINVHAGTQDTSAQMYLNVLGLSDRNGFDFDRFKTAQSYWKGGRYAAVGPRLTATDADLSSLQNFLGFENSYAWFSEILDTVTVFSRYLGGLTTLGSLPATGPSVPLVYNTVNVNSVRFYTNYENADYQFYSSPIVIADNLQWIYEDEIEKRYLYTARHTLTNAKFLWRHGAPVRGVQPSTNYFNRAEGARVGPYFTCEVQVDPTDPKKFVLAARTEQFSSVYTKTMRLPVLEGRVEMLRRDFYVPNPDQ